ncbi:MAG: hypothetical protein CMM50_06885 [Rhodospirillaceae bacterium]|nr:hypothetical protein [Rhodospirillaceae bacterium]
MRRNLAGIIALLVVWFPALPAQAQETSARFEDGSVIFSYDNRDCDGTLEGSLRWNPTPKKFEVCDGTEWGQIASENGASTDTAPDAFTFTDLTNHSLGAIALSETLSITGFDGPLIAEVSGAGTPEISINGGAWVTAGEINPGDSLRVRQVSSVSVSTATVAAVTVGTVTDNWSVTTKAGQTRIFRTTVGITGASIGSLANADSICQTNAANLGFSGTWKAILSDEATNAKDRVTIAYPVIRAEDGLTVDTANIFDGSLDTNGVTESSSTSFVWTGSNPDGTTEAGLTCSSWSSSAGSGRHGRSNRSDGTWMTEGGTICTGTRSLYCVDQ